MIFSPQKIKITSGDLEDQDQRSWSLPISAVDLWLNPRKCQLTPQILPLNHTPRSLNFRHNECIFCLHCYYGHHTKWAGYLQGGVNVTVVSFCMYYCLAVRRSEIGPCNMRWACLPVFQPLCSHTCSDWGKTWRAFGHAPSQASIKKSRELGHRGLRNLLRRLPHLHSETSIY